MAYKLNDDDFLEHLSEHIQSLKDSAGLFDSGQRYAAKRMAGTIRSLIHDNPDPKSNTVSLLMHLKSKTMKFYDTSFTYSKNLISHDGLTFLRATQTGVEYHPFLDDLPPNIVPKMVSFEKWYDTIVYVDKKGKKFTRGSLILSLANKDGGVHVDSMLPEAFADFSRFNSMGWTYVVDEKEISVTGPHLAAMRQITHEILVSLQDEFPQFA